MEITLLPRFGGASLLCPQKQCCQEKQTDFQDAQTKGSLREGAGAEGG